MLTNFLISDMAYSVITPAMEKGSIPVARNGFRAI
jgi:hypothetical protein